MDPARVDRVAQELRARGHDVRTLEDARRDGVLRTGRHPSATPGTVGGTVDVGDLHRAFYQVRLADRYDLATELHGGSRAHVVTHRVGRAGPRLPDSGEARRVLLGHLEVVFGIGPATAARLRRDGVTSIARLPAVVRHQAAAAEVLAEWDEGDLDAISARLTRRLGGRGHLLSALTCSLVAPEEVVYFDLETMGLWNNVAFLAGIGRVVDDGFVVRQFLAPGFADEPAVISLALRELARAKVVVTFNGRTADLPWLANRAFYHGLGPVPALVHVDLLYGTRRRFLHDQPLLQDVRLPTVAEHLLGLPRPETDIPSGLIPRVYDHYARDPDRRQGLLVPVLDHNRADIEALALLLERLCREVAPWP